METTNETHPNTPEVSSFMTRATNVFMSPGELYDEVALAPVQASSWAVPYVINILVAVFMTFMLFSTPALFDQMMATQREAMQQQVAQGKMSAADAEKAASFTTPSMMMAFGSVGAVVVTTALLFCVSLVLFASAKFGFQYPGVYKKFLEMYGLSTLIGAIGAIITVVMMVGMDSMLAQPGPVFFVRDSYVRGSFLHGFLSSLNVFTIWQVAVVGIGFARLTRKPTGVGMGVTFGIWLVWVLASSVFGWGMK